ncbi:Response regulator with CheY-like receiver domain and winged-helix DNA-binding domain protein [Deinococcus saxicola]|uniref:response regulator n=1 Tax=Deinococcus saxicola TaxID=249406 RepID=UPI0039F0AB5A
MTRPPMILLVEDDPNDVFMATLAFETTGVDLELTIAAHGGDALAYLQRSGPYTHRPAGFPNLILLDLNMPQMNGFELLRAMKQDGVLSRIPVVILTTSTSERDRETCTALGADGFLVKPQEFHGLLTLIGDLTTRWLPTARLAM